jgi:hypothetical protein
LTADLKPSTPDANASLPPRRILMLSPHPNVQGPIPKITPLLLDPLRAAGCEVTVEPWSSGVRETSSACVRWSLPCAST